MSNATPIRLYSKEQIEEWASKHADDAGRLARQLLDVMCENERKNEALLLAARWFKLYQEDISRYTHPASDADLLGMFDAMQEARLPIVTGNK